MNLTEAEIMCRRRLGETMADCEARLNGFYISYYTKGPDMSKFTEWLMEMYPKTDDYVYISKAAQHMGERTMYLRIKPDPQAFLEQMKDFDEMMED